MTREPLRSRILTITGLPIAAAGCVATVWARSQPSGWGLLLTFGFLIPLIVALRALVFSVRRILRDPAAPTGGFEVAAGAFRLEPQISPGWLTLGQLSFYGLLLGQLIILWREGPDPDPVGGPVMLGIATIFTVVMAVWTVFVAMMAVASWKAGPLYELTPAGIRSGASFASWFIPWEALHAGGPPRPTLLGMASAPVRLAVARPELVQRRGLLRLASPRHPVLPAAENAHPWLLADTIRWYAEHPEHRGGIGTRIEHDRLISTVTADYPRIDGTPRPRPGLVTAAVWVAVAGAGIGFLLAAANLYIAVAFEDRIAAALRAAEEEPLFAEPVLPAFWLGLVRFWTLPTKTCSAWPYWRSGRASNRSPSPAASRLSFFSRCAPPATSSSRAFCRTQPL